MDFKGLNPPSHALFFLRVNTFKLLLNLSKSQNNLMYVILPQTTQCDLAA